MWNLISVYLESVIVSVQDRCTVCAKRAIDSKIVLDAPNGAQVVAHFSPFGDSVILMQDRCTVCIEHTMGSEIVLDAPDGTPR